MAGYNFTQRMRKTLQLSREEAARLGHAYVSPDHLVLGLAREGGGVASAAAKNLGKDLQSLAAVIESRMEPGATPASANPDLPYTSTAKKVLELSMYEAREFQHSYVGTEHLLLGISREGQSVAAQVLAEAGLGLDSLRSETLRLLGHDLSGEEPRRSVLPYGIPQPASRTALMSDQSEVLSQSVYLTYRLARAALILSFVAILVAVAALVVAV